MVMRRTRTGTPTAPRAGQAQPPVKGTQRALNWLKRWAIPLIGGVTPVALILINVAVWINDHVGALRLWVAVAAFVSGMMFNSWLGLSVYRWVQRRHPDWTLVHETNQELLLVLGMGLITLVTFLTSLALYLKLADARALPNGLTLWYGIIQIAYPFILKVYVDRDSRRRSGAGVASQPDATWSPPAEPVPPRWTPPAPPPGTLHQAYPPGQGAAVAQGPAPVTERGAYLPPS